MVRSSDFMRKVYWARRQGAAKIRWHCFTVLAKGRLWFSGAQVGVKLRVNGPLDLCLHPRGELVIGKSCRIQSGFTDNPVGGFRRTGLWVGPSAVLRLGNRVGISNSTIVAMREVLVEDEVFIGGDCKIYDTDFHQVAAEERVKNLGPVRTAPIRIGRRAFLGGHCIILKGVSIGEGAVIGAGSVVTGPVPSGEIWAGTPARFIRRLDAVRT